MKVFIPYEKHSSRDTFEGTRLRKTLKGECEISGIAWADNLLKEPNLAHFISCADEGTLADVRWRHIPVVVSACYAEKDPYCSFLRKDNGGIATLSPKAIRFLNRSDMVFVPNEMMKNVCLSSGIKTPIAIHEMAINMQRFCPNTAEANIFPRYFAIRPEAKIAVITGEYENRTCIKQCSDLASLCPETEFYFFGTSKRISPQIWASHYHHHSPPNLHFKKLVEDDVYRSALMRANAFIHLDYLHPESMGYLDAFAAKTQIIALHENPYEPLLKNGVTAWICPTVKDIASCLHSLYSGEKKSTIIAGYELATNHSLDIGAKGLLSLYTQLLQSAK